MPSETNAADGCVFWHRHSSTIREASLDALKPVEACCQSRAVHFLCWPSGAFSSCSGAVVLAFLGSECFGTGGMRESTAAWFMLTVRRRRLAQREVFLVALENGHL